MAVSAMMGPGGFASSPGLFPLERLPYTIRSDHSRLPCGSFISRIVPPNGCENPSLRAFALLLACENRLGSRSRRVVDDDKLRPERLASPMWAQEYENETGH